MNLLNLATCTHPFSEKLVSEKHYCLVQQVEANSKLTPHDSEFSSQRIYVFRVILSVLQLDNVENILFYVPHLLFTLPFDLLVFLIICFLLE